MGRGVSKVPYLHHLLSTLETGPEVGALARALRSYWLWMRALRQLPRHDPLPQDGQGPAGAPSSKALGEDQDQREKNRMRTRRSTPSSTTMAHHCRRSLVMWDTLAIFLRTPSIRDWVWSIS